MFGIGHIQVECPLGTQSELNPAGVAHPLTGGGAHFVLLEMVIMNQIKCFKVTLQGTV